MIYSSHVFMFPFRFDWNSSGFNYEFQFYKEKPIDVRVPFSLNNLSQRLKSSGWKHEKFDLKQDVENGKEYMYNEFAYFYDYVRDSLYNLDESDAISYYFTKDIPSGKYIIQTTRREKPYELYIAGISLRIFKTGIGVLSIELDNTMEDDFEDILNINDFGRRIYPQYIKDKSAEQAKGSFLAQSISITGMEQEEDFTYAPAEDIVIGKHILYLLGDAFSQDKNESATYYIQPSLDDRMYVVSYAINKDLVSSLRDRKYLEPGEKSDDWCRYLYIDNDDKTVYSDAMQRKLLEKATYDRWMGYEWGDTLQGVTRYSFVTLADSDFSLMHSKTMYFQMMHMLLVIRASILRFSDEISALAASRILEIDKLTRLYQLYLTFYNRIYFKEVTHQEQGIELYGMALEQMKIVDHMEKLDGKFTKLYDYSNMQVEKRTTKMMNALSIFGAVFVPISLALAVVSVSPLSKLTEKPSLYILGGSVAVTVVALWFILKKGDKNE